MIGEAGVEFSTHVLFRILKKLVQTNCKIGGYNITTALTP